MSERLYEITFYVPKMGGHMNIEHSYLAQMTAKQAEKVRDFLKKMLRRDEISGFDVESKDQEVEIWTTLDQKLRKFFEV